MERRSRSPNEEEFVKDPFHDTLDHINDSDDTSFMEKKDEIINKIKQSNSSKPDEPLNKGFTIVSYNAQKSVDNLWNILQKQYR